MSKNFVLIVFILLVLYRAGSASEDFVLKTSEATLTIDLKGNLKIMLDKSDAIRINTPIKKIWNIIIKDKQTGKEYETSESQDFTINKEGDIIQINVSGLQVDNHILPVEARFTISVRDDAFCFSGSLKVNTEGWIFRDLEYPIIEGTGISGEKAGVYWPVGLGEHFADSREFGRRNYTYPSVYGSMPWFSINTPDAGIYFGSHDPALGMKDFYLACEKAVPVFKSGIKFPVFSGRYSVPDVIVKLFQGNWYECPKLYRSWFDRNFKLNSPPEWVKTDDGWLLAILKQQNGEVMWPYKEIDKLCDIAKQLKLRTIGLYGWAHGGHDRYYPGYFPDNLLGGREELVKAIERAHLKGMKIILYANSKVADVSTEFFRNLGNETMIFDEKTNPVLDVWRKHKNSTPVVFAQQCTGSEIWRKRMLDLALQAENLGADGIMMDQLGGTPKLCFSPYHDHLLPQESSDFRVRMIHEIQNHMKEVNPDFILMAEGQTDATINDIDYFHGCSSGYSIRANGFPELFRYTFPELIATQRNPNPMITVEEANFALISGLRHEIECRYPSDVKYLLEGTIPSEEDYADIYSPPEVGKIKQLPSWKATAYVRELIGFENSHAEFFRTGKFIAREGIHVSGDDIEANGFIKGNRIGVAVWNKNSKEKRSYSINVPGYHLVKASEPGKTEVNLTSPLDANSIRLLIYEKQ